MRRRPHGSLSSGLRPALRRVNVSGAPRPPGITSLPIRPGASRHRGRRSPRTCPPWFLAGTGARSKGGVKIDVGGGMKLVVEGFRRFRPDRHHAPWRPNRPQRRFLTAPTAALRGPYSHAKRTLLRACRGRGAFSRTFPFNRSLGVAMANTDIADSIKEAHEARGGQMGRRLYRGASGPSVHMRHRRRQRHQGLHAL